MSFLKKGSSGVSLGPQFYLGYGPEKTGKSSFFAQWPKAAFADIENGTSNLDIHKRYQSDDIPDLTTLLEFYDDMIADKARTYEMIVTDSVTALGKYITKHICKETNRKSIDEIPHGGGYARIDAVASELVQKYAAMKRAGYNVGVIGHTKVKTFSDPILNSTYDRFVLQCDDRLAHHLKSAADNIFFINREVRTFQDKNMKTRAESEGEIVIHTEFSAAFDAGNRLNLPPQMPLSYTALKKAVTEYQPKAKVLRKEIEDVLARADKATLEGAQKAMLEAGNDVTQLIRIKNKLVTMVKPQVSA